MFINILVQAGYFCVMITDSPLLHHIVIGTAGHVDHGKTTLIKTLTGIDADRLIEEKKRGITIDLGFAHYQAHQAQIAFVDVPGHEKFVHNMLAGVAGLDAVLLVIAADEGIMPQTREHFQICQLLGMAQGLIALTCCDRIDDPVMIELCREETEELIQDSFLAGCPIIPVSSTTGEGIEELKQQLQQLTNQIAHREVSLPFRFAVDRSFSVKGFGTIVTGTVSQGQISIDTEVQQYPQHRSLRVRGIQTHGQTVSTIQTGQRAAFNLAGISKEEIHRGDQLSEVATLLTGYLFNAEISLLGDLPRFLQQRERVHLYLGSQEVIACIVLLEQNQLKPGTSGLAQLRLESQVSIRFGDRFIVRSDSPLRTIGGGIILDPNPHKSRRVQKELATRLRRMLSADDQTKLEEITYLQSVRGVTESEFSARSGLSHRQINKCLQNLQSQQKIFSVDPIGKRFLHQEHLQRIGQFVCKLLAQHHRKFPEREGMTLAELVGKLAVLFPKEREVENVFKYFVKQKMVQRNGQYFAIIGHQQQHSIEQQDLLQRLLNIITTAGFQPPRRTILLEQAGVSEKQGTQLIKQAIYNQQLIRIADDLFYPIEKMEIIQEYVRQYFTEKEQMTVIDFKNLLQIGRKHAVELLEYCDKQRWTIRIDNHRILGKIVAKSVT